MSAQSVKSLADRRVRRQKIFIAVGSVVLLAVLGFELPKVLGNKNGESAAPAITAATPGAVTPAVVVPAGRLPNTDRVSVVRDSNQLISFGLFKSKDPFVQQISASTPATAVTPQPQPAPVIKPTASPAPPASLPGLVPAGGTAAPATVPAAPGATPAPTATTPATPAPAVDALIATNGVCERIAPNGTFPNNENIFRLVSIAPNGKSVEIGIVGGSFDSGRPTTTLKLGEKLTLVNTADGTRYVIALKASCTVVSPSGSSTSSPSAPATPVAPPASPPATTPTTTATTPIVTDSLDTTTTNPFGG